MKKTFTKQYLRDNCGCYKETPGKLEACSFMQKEGLISIMDILESEIPLDDKDWFIENRCKLTEDQLTEMAIAFCQLGCTFNERYLMYLIEFTNNN